MVAWTVLIVVLVLAYTARRPILRAAGGFLVVVENNRSRDAIVLLNGNISTRPYAAVDLYRKGRAPILIARLADTEEVRLGVIPNVTDATRDLLVRLGVAEADVTVIGSDRWVAGTWAEAIILCSLVRERGFRRVAVVTDAFHTRRARWTFLRVMGDSSVEFFCVSTRYSMDLVNQWWRSEYGLLQVLNEYVKMSHYCWRWYVARRRQAVENDLPDGDRVRRYVAGRD